MSKLKHQYQKKNQGFSLLEIIIVVLTISILAVLAVPQLNSSLQLNRIQTGASLVSSKLSEARLTAIKQNRQVSFVLDEANSLVWIEANSTVIGKVDKLPQDINIKIAPNSIATTEIVTFNSMGRLDTLPSIVSTYYQTKRLEVPVSISIVGKITVGAMNSY